MKTKGWVIALLAMAVIFAGSAPNAFSAPTWLYDGTSYAKTTWYPDTVPADQNNDFGYGGFSVTSTAAFAGAHAEGANYALKASSYANGKVQAATMSEWHVGMASARANALISDLLPGTYRIGFDYSTTDTTNTSLLGTWPKVGFETAAGSQEWTGSGYFTSIIDVTTDFFGYWIAFFASSQSNATEGYIESTATISNITVAPVSLLPIATPIPGAFWFFAPGLAGFIALKRRYRG